jgi:hypothetical protein
MPPFEENLTFNTRTIVASSDLSAKQYFAINNKTVANAAKAIDGILQNNPKSGQAGTIAVAGITKAVLASGNAITDGVTQLEVATGGKLQILAAGIAVAIARQTITSQGADVLAAVELLPANGVRV